MVSTVFLHVHGVSDPWDQPLVNLHASFPIHRLGALHNNSCPKGADECPDPIEVSHQPESPSLFQGLQSASVDKKQPVESVRYGLSAGCYALPFPCQASREGLA